MKSLIMVSIPHTERFKIGKYPVTRKLWMDVMGSMPKLYTIYPKGIKSTVRLQFNEDYPITSITHSEIIDFIIKLNSKTGKIYRLPTEAEWEFAAKGGQNYKHAGGDNFGDVGQFEVNVVGQKSPNGYDLYDMSGNVWELCSGFELGWGGNAWELPIKGGIHAYDMVKCISRPAAVLECSRIAEFMKQSNVGFRLCLE